MRKVVVGLDLHLKKTTGTVMSMDGRIIKKERFDTSRGAMAEFLDGIPKGTKVALESLGFCWPWIDLIEELGYDPMLANPAKTKIKAEDIKTDDVDSETLAHLTRMNWLPTCYVPSREFRWLRSVLRHRAFRRRMSTALKNRTWSEFRKRDARLETSLGTKSGRDKAMSCGIYEVGQNVELLNAIEGQIKLIESSLKERYADAKPVKLLESIPGIGFVTALTLYAEICDVKRFASPEKLAHYAGLVPRVSQSGERTVMGRETRANKWLKWALIEASWSHVNWCPDGRLAGLYRKACDRKRNKKKAIKIVARKLVNVIWAVWTYEKEFMME